MLTNDAQPTCGILYIDDEEKALKYFHLAFSDKFKVFTAKSGKEGLELLRREAKDIGIVLSDQRMPEMLGAEILGIVREEYPTIVRILITAYSDLESAIQAVNTGHIYQYVVKPAEVPELKMVLQRAADYHRVLTERNELLALKMTTLQRIVCSDRLKWLLLSSRYWDETAQLALRRVLLALVKALPDTPAPLLTGKEKFSANQFEIGTLIRGEYHNALRCLDVVDKARTEATADAAAQLNAFAGALIKKYELTSDQVDLTISAKAEMSLRPAGPSFATGDFLKTLFGVLLERETPEASILFFDALFALATVNGSLAISVAPASPEAKALNFTFAFTEKPSSDDVIDALAEKFSSWDIARL